MKARLILGGVLLASAVALFLLWFGQSTVWVRDRVVSALNERFASQVELGSLQLSLLPAPPRLRHRPRLPSQRPDGRAAARHDR